MKEKPEFRIEARMGHIKVGFIEDQPQLAEYTFTVHRHKAVLRVENVSRYIDRDEFLSALFCSKCKEQLTPIIYSLKI